MSIAKHQQYKGDAAERKEKPIINSSTCETCQTQIYAPYGHLLAISQKTTNILQVSH